MKILDFGLATLRQSQAGEADVETRTREGVVFGTVGHKSPERRLWPRR